MTLIKLEPLCAECATHIVEDRQTNQLAVSDRENLITKALGVLSENGLYSMAVFLVSCHNSEYGVLVLCSLNRLWALDTIRLLDSAATEPRAMLEKVRGLTQNLSTMILAKKLAEQTLVFARYHAKALS